MRFFFPINSRLVNVDSFFLFIKRNFSCTVRWGRGNRIVGHGSDTLAEANVFDVVDCVSIERVIWRKDICSLIRNVCNYKEYI